MLQKIKAKRYIAKIVGKDDHETCFLYFVFVSFLKCTFMRGSRKLSQRGSNSDNAFFCLVDEGRRENPNTTHYYKWAIIGPPAKRHLNGVSLAYR